MEQTAHLTLFVQELTRHQTHLRSLIRCLLFQPQHVEEVLQETNLVLWEKAHAFQANTSFWAWASTIARFQVLAHLKKRQRDRHVFDGALMEQIAAVAGTAGDNLDQRRAALLGCLEKLSRPQRQLLEQRYGTDQPIEHIAQAVGRPAGSVRLTLFRIRQALLKCIERQLGRDTIP